MNPTPEVHHPTPAEEVLDPISAELRGLLDAAGGRSMSLAEIEAHLKDRGYALLVLFLAAPFPIPNIPGLSVPFGIAITLIGLAFMMRRRPQLPKFILRTRLEFATLQRVIPYVAGLMERLERHIKPRMLFLVKGPVMTSLFGLSVVSGGFFLALPLPIPLTNGPPALSIIFLVVGMLCRDGLMMLIGHILGVAAWAYLGLWIYFGSYLWDRMHHITAWFHHLWVVIRNWF
jgi:hypothetical protein